MIPEFFSTNVGKSPEVPKCCHLGCNALALYCVWELRQDLPFCDTYTYSCGSHIRHALRTVQLSGCEWRWSVEELEWPKRLGLGVK